MKKTLVFASLFAIAISLSACSDGNSGDVTYRGQQAIPPSVTQAAPAPVQAAPAPVIIQQQPQHSSTGDILMGAAIGAGAMHLMNNSNNKQPEVVERRIVETKYIERPAPVATPAPPPAPVAKAAPVPSPAPAAVAATAKPSYSSAFSAPAPAPAPKPSYASSFSKPSYSAKTSYSSSFSSSSRRK